MTLVYYIVVFVVVTLLALDFTQAAGQARGLCIGPYGRRQAYYSYGL